MTLAHVAGLPIEETLASVGPVLLAGSGLVWANLRGRFARSRPSASGTERPQRR
jgi:hypothetical protein